MRQIMVINAKGGSGKTTIATNLASYFATQNKKVTIIDYDPQGSSLAWLDARSPAKHPIQGIKFESGPKKKGKKELFRKKKGRKKEFFG